MEVYHWIGGHGFDLLEGVGIIASLTFAALAFRREEKAQHTTSLLAITAAHREIWSAFLERPNLARVLAPEVDLLRFPVTQAEEIFVTFLFHHLQLSFRAMQNGVFTTPQALQQDIRAFFSLPIPKAVWEQARPLQDLDFAAFVDAALRVPK